LGAELGDLDGDPEAYLAPLPPENMSPAMREKNGQSFAAVIGQRSYLINTLGAPYFQDGFAETIPDLRLRSAFEAHSAWLSADLFQETPSEDERPAIYADLGRILAQFASDDCLAIYCPEIDVANEFAPSVVEALRSGAGLSVFDQPTFDPVVSVDMEGPEMKAAIAEARRRWPEFLAAFQQNQDPESLFGVKARFTDGENEEFMWLVLHSISGSTLTGQLANAPVALANVHEGDIVTVEIDDLHDWHYEINGEPQGGFTMKVMDKAMKRQRS
jgi:uncharacterized protein YegJ (DUF2314 family)